MRGIGMAAAIGLLAGCGSPATENRAEPEAEAEAEAEASATAGESNAVVAPEEPAETAANGVANGVATGASPCLIQGEQRLEIAALRAVGTEPFWGARIQGRCVTYSTPEDQQGTRVWTRYALAPGGGVWIGQLGGKPFELRTRAEPGCSDGMSDGRYPIAVELLVGGERRKGCAEPL